MEEGETPQETAIREAKEETGLDIKLIEILGVGKDIYQSQDLLHIVPISFIAKISGGKIKAADDVAELKWFPLVNLPEKISFKGNKIALKLVKKRHHID